ncbi:unnamed protein product [Closterium sp. NIES-65]|nr:unnamed protein product [Closterium sp. NIES-65]
MTQKIESEHVIRLSMDGRLQAAAAQVAAYRGRPLHLPRAGLADGGHRQAKEGAGTGRPSKRYDHVPSHPPVGARFSCGVPGCTAGRRCRHCDQRLTRMVVHDDSKARGKKAAEEQFEGWMMEGIWWKKVDIFCKGRGAAAPHGDEEDRFGGKGADRSDLQHHATADGGVDDAVGGRGVTLERGGEGGNTGSLEDSFG